MLIVLDFFCNKYLTNSILFLFNSSLLIISGLPIKNNIELFKIKEIEAIYSFEVFLKMLIFIKKSLICLSNCYN